jgi:hypothetical protein
MVAGAEVGQQRDDRHLSDHIRRFSQIQGDFSALNDLHERAVHLAARAGRAVLCTKPLGRNAMEAKSMLEAVETKIILKDRQTGEIIQKID